MSENSYFEHKITILNEQIGELKKQNKDLKNINSVLCESLQQMPIAKQKIQSLLLQNMQLHENHESAVQKCEELQQYYEHKLKQLHSQIQQYQQQIELLGIEHEKALLHKQQEVSIVNGIVRSRNSEIDHCNKKLHNLTIDKIKNDNIQSQFLKNSSVNQTNNQISENIENKSFLSNTMISNPKKKRAYQYMKKDKQQLKVIMRALKNAKKSLEEGSQEVSFLNCKSTKRISHTYCQ